MYNEIVLRRRNKVTITPCGYKNKSLATALMIDLSSLGYTFSSELLKAVSTLNVNQIEWLRTQLITNLSDYVGSNVKHIPLFSGFPNDVPDQYEYLWDRISGFIQMLGITEVITMDKFGSKATILNGQLAQFDGSPVMVSEFMRQDLNTSGVYDGTTETDTEILLVHTPAFRNAEKPGGLKIETARDIETGQNIAVAHRRLDFKQVNSPVGTAEETVGVGYSLTS